MMEDLARSEKKAADLDEQNEKQVEGLDCL